MAGNIPAGKNSTEKDLAGKRPSGENTGRENTKRGKIGGEKTGGEIASTIPETVRVVQSPRKWVETLVKMI